MSARARAELRIGISGWRYEPWRGVFYPEGLVQAHELRHAARHLINGSFYSLQRPEHYRRWYEETPDDFLFAVKGGRFITHMKKLRDVDQALANFFASGVLCLEERLGPILWQMPASLPCDLERFDAFFERLPRDTSEASKLARKHAAWLAPRAVTRSARVRPVRHAVEARGLGCDAPAFVELLRKHGFACVVADSAGKFPYLEDVTADFVYVRLHGAKRIYESGYSARALARWADRIEAWHAGREPLDGKRVLAAPLPRKLRRARDVFVYFDNDAKVHAPFDAAALAQKLGVTIGEPVRNVRARLSRRRPLREPIRGGTLRA